MARGIAQSNLLKFASHVYRPNPLRARPYTKKKT